MSIYDRETPAQVFWSYVKISGQMILGIFIIALLFFLLTAPLAEKRRAWMAECLKDRKQYECEALWRAGDSNMFFVPIIIPGR